METELKVHDNTEVLYFIKALLLMHWSFSGQGYIDIL